MAYKDIKLKIVNITRQDLIKLFINRVSIDVKSTSGGYISLNGVSNHDIQTYEGPFHRHVFKTRMWFKNQVSECAEVDIESEDGRSYHGTIKYQKID